MLSTIYTGETTNMKEKEAQIMTSLRNNARESLTKMSRKTGIPVSTIYERLKKFEKKVIKKHTCILDFQELGYDLRLTVLLKTRTQEKEQIKKHLRGHHSVNTIMRINNGYDYLIEAIFKNMAEVQTFLDELDKKGARKREEYYVLEEIARENFLSGKTHLALIHP